MGILETHSVKRQHRLHSAPRGLIPPSVALFGSVAPSKHPIILDAFLGAKSAYNCKEGGAIAARHGVDRAGADQEYAQQHLFSPWHFYGMIRDGGYADIKLGMLGPYEKQAYTPLVRGEISVDTFYKIVEKALTPQLLAVQNRARSAAARSRAMCRVRQTRLALSSPACTVKQ